MVRADVADPDQVDALFDVAAGIGQVTGVVNNAGSTLHLGDLADTPVDVVRRVIDVNLTGAVLVARRAVQDLVAGGAVVNVSSAAATLGAPHEYVHYAAAKAGVDALTVGLAQEVAARGIRVNGVAPGHRAHRHPRRGRRPRPARAGRRHGPAGPGRRAGGGRRGDRVAALGRVPVRHRRDAARGRWTMRVLLALGGNAMTGPDGGARPEEQIAAAQVAMRSVAELVASDIDVVITHGNGPQVGNLLVKNEIAASVVPPVPLDWCGAQTQATLGFVLMNALDDALRERGVRRPSAALVTRDPRRRRRPGLHHAHQADRAVPARTTRPRCSSSTARPGRTGASRGWRRVVASPEPREILDAGAVHALVEAGFVVVANGGGGIPVVREAAGLRGVEAVIDKDLGAALLARSVGRRRARRRDRRAARRAAVRHPRGRGHRPGRRTTDARRSPPRGTSPAGRWARRSRRPAGSSSRAAPAPSSPRWTASWTPSPARPAPSIVPT